MDSAPNCFAYAPSAPDSVDPFFKDALQNPRHRLVVLRMELDIQKFMQNPEQDQFEFPHFPTSYLRLTAHRVAQHYGLLTMVADSGINGSGSTIVVRKTPESRYPDICLSDIPVKQQEADKSEQIKIVIRTRVNGSSPSDTTELDIKQNPARTVEERKEEYDRARARIFSNSSSPDPEVVLSQAATDGKSMCSSRDKNDNSRSKIEEPERTGTRESTPRVAIFRDREKDRSDPDYDRSYDRYVRCLPPNQCVGLGALPISQLPFIQYRTGFDQMGQLPRTQTPINYGPSHPVMSPFCAVGANPSSADALYMNWPNPAIMYTQSYEHFKNAVLQAQFYQQPLSFNYSQNQH